MRVPRSTYRLQITSSFTLHDAADLVPYLALLGADWVYLSPILAAEPGSDHGYDVVDHTRVDPLRGGPEGLAALSAAAHRVGLGVLVDIVPNHVGVASPHLSSWWWDVLANGPGSAQARAFDIDWAAGDGRLLLPVLGDGPDELDALSMRDGELRYYDHRFPIAPGTGHGSAVQVHERQHYRLVSWRRGDAELNYRRFFTISTLAGLRVEEPDVFAASHAEIRRWFDEHLVDGLRIDHPDGLADPAGYLEQLAELTGGAYVVVEKILEPGERLPNWACRGTTGYDALALLDRLFVDPAGQTALDDLDTELRGGLRVDWPAMTFARKHDVATGSLAAEVARLARLVPDLDDAADAIAALLAAFPVYRSYLPEGAEDLQRAASVAIRHRPTLAPSIGAVAERLRDPAGELCVRFQQTSGMVMAKGVEDNAFYRWSRLTSLTEVGADPAVFAVSTAEFHAAQAARLASWPDTMTALSTHDTKRSEDVRARISVLSECADEWAAAVRRWLRMTPLADPALANLTWQAAVGAWPIEPDRLQGYAEKAAREARTRTSWTDPDPAFERQLSDLVVACTGRLADEFAGWASRITLAGWWNSLSAKLIQLTSPGVPDVYQGTERWDLSLVDPDNRRPVDHALSGTLLGRIDAGERPGVEFVGAAKLLVTGTALRLRRDRPDLFTGYHPLLGRGPAAGHLVAFDRGGAATVATRLPLGLQTRGGWRDTTVGLPAGQWRNLLDLAEESFWAGEVAVGRLLTDLPVALLVRED